MASLKELRQRQRSVKSTKKITQAMKMIASAKLRKAQEKAEAGRPYANLMAEVVDDLVVRADKFNLSKSDLLTGNGNNKTRMFIVVTSNRGLCGGFNTSIIKKAKSLIKDEYSNDTNIVPEILLPKLIQYYQKILHHGKDCVDQC